MSRSLYYGKLNVQEMSSSAHKIWLSREEEPPDSPPWGFLSDYVTDMSSVETHELVEKMMETANLTPREEFLVRAVLFNGFTFKEAGDQLFLCPQRARQIILQAAHKLRRAHDKCSRPIVETHSLRAT